MSIYYLSYRIEKYFVLLYNCIDIFYTKLWVLPLWFYDNYKHELNIA